MNVFVTRIFLSHLMVKTFSTVTMVTFGLNIETVIVEIQLTGMYFNH